MTIQRFKLSLNAARFPLVSTEGNRSVFVPGLDSAPRTPKQYIGAEPSTDYNTAQVLYMENVMPVAAGLRSAGYTQLIAPTVNTDFDTIFPLRDSDENVVLYSPAKGKNYVLNPITSVWESTTHATIWGGLWTVAGGSEAIANSRVTYAYVDGKTLVCYSRLESVEPTLDMSIMLWNPATATLTPATTSLANMPFAAGTIDGIASSNGYLLVWSGLSVAWAAFNGTTFDFSPYADGAFTGAGNQIPEDVQGPILAVTGVSGGFMMFTARNCVGASYHAQNSVAPWIFREVPNAGGLATYESMTVEGSLAATYAYTTAGLQRVNLNSAESIHPQVSDFLTGRVLESFDYGTKLLAQTAITQDLSHKVTNIGNRYVVISFGATAGIYEYALVWDLALERFGKLKFQHTDCFYYGYPPGTTGATYSDLLSVGYDELIATYADMVTYPTVAVTPAQYAMAFLTATGAVHLAHWEDLMRTDTDQGVAVLGRVQLARARGTQINRVEVDGMNAGTVHIAPSYTGQKTESPVALVTVNADGNNMIFGGAVTQKNCNIIVSGAFELSALIVEAIATGQI